MDIENWTIEKALEIGAEMELESYKLYTDTAIKAKYPGAKKLLEVDDVMRDMLIDGKSSDERSCSP